MKNILIVFFIFNFLVLMIVFPFKTRAMFHFNLLELKGFYSVKTWIVKLFCGKILFEEGKFILTNQNTIFEKNYNPVFMKLLSKEVLDRLDVKKVELYFSCGVVEDSFSSAILCGSISSFVESIYGFLSLKYDDVKMYKDIKPTFNENNLELTGDIVISVSALKLMISVLKANRLNKRMEILENEG